MATLQIVLEIEMNDLAKAVVNTEALASQLAMGLNLQAMAQGQLHNGVIGEWTGEARWVERYNNSTNGSSEAYNRMKSFHDGAETQSEGIASEEDI